MMRRRSGSGCLSISVFFVIMGCLGIGIANNVRDASEPATAAFVVEEPMVSASATAVPVQREIGVVTKVIDGDTFEVRIGEITERVRVLGIDTPELGNSAECFAVEATVEADWLLSGVTVRLEGDPTQDNRDRYNRLLRYVWLPDRSLFNQQMIANGFAREYTFNQPYREQVSFRAAQQAAQTAQRGIWSPQACATPSPTLVPVPPTLVPPTLPVPTQPVPTAVPPTPVPEAPRTTCDPSYPDVCIPPGPPDLDCGDIPFRRFRVFEPDPHRFDGDNDGVGCERG
jgi:micrococcal nuclease